jgi:Transposase DDE domain group 1
MVSDVLGDHDTGGGLDERTLEDRKAATTAAAIDGRTLYERVYCARGEMENRIKEQQLDLFDGRTSVVTVCQSAPKFDPRSACKIDPRGWTGCGAGVIDAEP